MIGDHRGGGGGEAERWQEGGRGVGFTTLLRLRVLAILLR
jgi:hypothetical protein